MQSFYSIGPKISTLVAPPSMKSTEHGLNYFRCYWRPRSKGDNALVSVRLCVCLSAHLSVLSRMNCFTSLRCLSVCL